MKLSICNFVFDYRYFVRLSYDDFLKIGKIKSRNIKFNEGVVTFSTTKKGLNTLKTFKLDTDIVVIDRLHRIFTMILLKHLPATISLLLVFGLFLVSGKYIRDITFEDDEAYNYEIYETVSHCLVKKGIFYELDVSLNDLNRTLRNTFQQYAYIGVKKSGSKLIIELTCYDTNNVKKDNLNLIGDIIAKYDGYIIGIETKKGVVAVTISQTVKKGDLLISGNINYKVNPNDLSKLVSPEGIVLGEVVEYYNYTVQKEVVGYEYDSFVKKHYELSLFNKIINSKNSSLNEGYQKKTDVVNMFNKIKLVKVESFSKIPTIISYNYDDALKYARSLIYYDFNLSKISDKEYIKDITCLKIEETTKSYNYVFLVKSIRNIGEFKEYKKG